MYTSKNILQNISFDEKKAERNRFILSLSLSLRVPKGLKKKRKGNDCSIIIGGRKGRTK